MPQQPTRITGSYLNEAWEVGAAHALYREDGRWYHQLLRFPGALFDRNGYIVFRTKAEYETCAQLRRRKDLNVRGGIASIPGYVRMR